MYKLTISKQTDQPKTNWTISAKCEATEEGADPNIFVFHAKPDGDTYSNVASLADMNSFPIGAPTKIVNELGWKPSRPFEVGLKETIKWYLDNDAWTNDIISGEYLEYMKKQYK